MKTLIEKLKTMDITERLKQRFNVPGNWDKHDYEIHRYSFDDLLEAAELVREYDSLPPVSKCSAKKCNEPTYEFGMCHKHFCISEMDAQSGC